MRWPARCLWAVMAVGALTHASQLDSQPGRYSATAQSLTPLVFSGAILVSAAMATIVWRFARRGREEVVASVVAPTAGLVVGAISMAPTMIGWQFGGRGPAPLPDAQPTSVMASNLLFTNPDLGAVVEAITAVDPHIVVMSEVTDAHEMDLLSRPIVDTYPYRRTPRGNSDLMVWSKYPFTEQQPQTRSDVAVLDVAMPGGDVRVIAVHTQAPSFDADTFARDMRALRVEARAEEPVVLLGDFNSGWFNPPFRALLADAGLRSAIREAGPRWGMTWPTDSPLPPIAALDHVLVSDQLAVMHADYVTVPGSDHRAVVATIAPAG